VRRLTLPIFPQRCGTIRSVADFSATLPKYPQHSRSNHAAALAAAAPELVGSTSSAPCSNRRSSLFSPRIRASNEARHPTGWCAPEAPSTCCRAEAIIDLVYELDNAIVDGVEDCRFPGVTRTNESSGLGDVPAVERLHAP
jgi:hypothetical protein